MEFMIEPFEFGSDPIGFIINPFCHTTNVTTCVKGCTVNNSVAGCGCPPPGNGK